MHHFKDFKSFRKAEIDLRGPLTILVGPNGSGKSNALEGVEVLAAIAAGHPVGEIADLGRAGALNVRGGLQGCPRHGCAEFTLGFSVPVALPEATEPGRYSVTVAPLPEPRIASESMWWGETMLFRTLDAWSKPGSADRKVECNTFAPGGNAHHAVSATRSVLSLYERIAPDSLQPYWPKMVEALREHLRASFVFHPRPSAMRRYERIGQDALLRDGSNLSAVLFGLQEGPRRRALRDMLFDQIRRVPDEPYDRFDFATTDLGDVMFGMREAHTGHLSDARMLSDGTLRTLAVLVAVATADAHTPVVVEEFDNGLHPSRVDSVVQAISRVGAERSVNVLLTTHNPEVLNALTIEQQQNVVLAFRSNDDFSSRLIRLPDIPRYDELLERGRLGDLVTRRVVDQYLAPNFAEDRQATMDRWLAEMAG